MNGMLVAVLSSTLPLRPEIGVRLYHAALRLHFSRTGVERIAGDLVSGKVVPLNRELVLGTLTGPAFQAEISTELGEASVCFLLTRQALERHSETLLN